MSEEKIKRNAIKIAMLGDSMVGKTAICNTFMNIEFSENNLSTIGVEKLETQLKLKNGEDIKLIIWDTAGQERFRSVALKSIKTAQGVVIVFDLTKRESFQNVVGWLKQINEYLNDNVSLVLFGNKCDIEEAKWEVSKEEVLKFSKIKNLPYFETSAKINKNIKEGFENVANAAYEKLEGNKNNNNNNIKLNNDKPKKKGGCCGGGGSEEKKKNKKDNK